MVNLFELKNNDWTSFGLFNTDVEVSDNNPYKTLGNIFRSGSVVELNGEHYVASGELGVMKLSKDEFISYPVITEDGENRFVQDIVKAENSLWVILLVNNSNQLRLIDPAGLSITSVEDEDSSPRIVLSTEYYDITGRLLSQEDTHTGIPHIMVTRYKDGGFKAKKLINK